PAGSNANPICPELVLSRHNETATIRHHLVRPTAPQNVSELKRFMGMITFIAKFVPLLSTKMHPLTELTGSDREWVWEQPQIDAFNKVKYQIANASNLALFDTKRPTTVSADSSSYRLGAVLLQDQDDGSMRPVAYAFRSLTCAEKKWAEIEKEALALAWACDRFQDFIIGIQATLETDHKPLVSILGGKKDLDNLTPRLQRLKMRLMRYSYTIKHSPGKKLVIADTFSRAPSASASTEDEPTEEMNAYIQLICSNYLPASDKKLNEIKQKTKDDPVCKFLSEFCSSGWPQRSDIPEICLPFWQHRHDISLVDGLLLKGSRIVIPEVMRAEMLNKLHEGHQGITKCRALAKQSVWWPRLSTQLKPLLENCTNCARYRTNRAEPLLPTSFPERPWQTLGMDLLKLQGQWYRYDLLQITFHGTQS
ncbi:unnamed protein product, partial [Nesidiocoris tenuis]